MVVTVCLLEASIVAHPVIFAIVLSLSVICFNLLLGISSHLLICGDFNYSDINWSNPLDPIPNTAHSQLFIDTFQDLFLYQHVDAPTRHSLSATPHTLDLVFTNEENMVTNLYYLPGLGNSDHVCMSTF